MARKMGQSGVVRLYQARTGFVVVVGRMRKMVVVVDIEHQRVYGSEGNMEVVGD